MRRPVAIAWSLALATAVAGCFVAPYDADELAEVRWSVELGRVGRPLTVLPGEREPDGLLHLESAGAYVQVTVTAPDLAGPLLASWPTPGATVSPEEPIALSLLVPAGSARRFELLAYVWDGAEVRAWGDDGTLVLDLEGGYRSEVEARLAPLATATLEVGLVGASERVTAAWVVDGDPAQGAVVGPGVAWPPVAIEGGELVLTELPAGRPLSLRLADAAGQGVAHDGAVVVLQPAERRAIAVKVTALGPEP